MTQPRIVTVKYAHHNSNRAMQSNEVLETLGVVGHLPAEGMPERLIQGVKVWVAPSQPPRNGWKSSKHRVLCECPQCHKVLSVGRLAQHVCKLR